MEDKELKLQIYELNKKLDLVLDELDYQKRQRMEKEDLKEDLTRVARGVFDSAVIELEGMSDSISTGDILYLGKKLLRNINNLTASFEQLESLKDLAADVAPLGKDMFQKLLDSLDKVDRKGYFLFIRETLSILDNIVISMSDEEMKNISKNAGNLINLIRLISKENIIEKTEFALKSMSENELEKRNYSYSSTLKGITSPEMRKTLAYVTQFIKQFTNYNPQIN